jgi:hypothetical protein
MKGEVVPIPIFVDLIPVQVELSPFLPEFDSSRIGLGLVKRFHDGSHGDFMSMEMQVIWRRIEWSFLIYGRARW